MEVVERFDVNASRLQLAGLRPWDVEWVDTILVQEPTVEVIEAVDPAVLGKVSPRLLRRLYNAKAITERDEHRLTTIVGIIGVQFLDVEFDVALAVAEVVPDAATLVATHLQVSPSLALELADSFTGTFGEFAALLACSNDTVASPARPGSV